MKKKYLYSLITLVMVAIFGSPAWAAETFDYGFTYASWGVSNNYDYTYRYVSNEFGSNINFLNLPSGATLDSSKNPVKWVREDGTIVEANIMNFLGSMMMFTMSAPWPVDPFGVWTCELPQGLFLSGDQESVAKTIRLTWVNPNAENPRPDFAVTKFNFFNTPESFENLEGTPVGAPAPMMYTLWATVEGGENMLDWETNPKSIASLNQNRGFVINTNWDEWIECFIAEVKPKNGGTMDVWNQETIQEIYGHGNVCKNYVGSSAADCEAYPHPLLGCGGNENTREYPNGVEYTLDIWFYDSMQKRGMDDSSEHKLAIGSYHLEFTGATMPFEYSDIAKLVSIDPMPANASVLGLSAGTPGEISSVSQPITFTWSAPVDMTAKYSLGGGAGEANVQSCTSNEDKTVWTVKPGASVISNGEGGYLDVFSFNVQAVDANGHYVKGNAGEKTNTMFTPEFNFKEVVTGINDVNEDLNIHIWSQNRDINMNGLSAGMNVSVYALNGLRIVDETTSNASVQIPNVLPGTYIIIVTANDGTQKASKFLHK